MSLPCDCRLASSESGQSVGEDIGGAESVVVVVVVVVVAEVRSAKGVACKGSGGELSLAMVRWICCEVESAEVRWARLK